MLLRRSQCEFDGGGGGGGGGDKALTRIADARALQAQLAERSRGARQTAENVEEVEDHRGNVYSRKTYGDLMRQGLV